MRINWRPIAELTDPKDDTPYLLAAPHCGPVLALWYKHSSGTPPTWAEMLGGEFYGTSVGFEPTVYTEATTP